MGHVQHAEVLERLGRTDDALAALARATALDDRDARAWAATGRLLERGARWREAAVAYDRALAADPTRAEAAMLAGLLHHHRLQDPRRAVDRYALVLRLVPTHYGAHYQLAMALLAAGRVAAAQAAWARFVPLAEAHGDRASLAAAPPALRTARP
jgi:tetratricopeptide (TPR) repeat protein